MLVKLSSYLKTQKKVYDCDYIILEGAAYVNGVRVREEYILKKIRGCHTNSEMLNSFLNSLIGFYGIIAYVDKKLYVFSDTVRSFPYFYKKENNVILISNFAIDLVSSEEVSYDNKLSSSQFLLSGYVSGKDTLIKGLYQTEAGKYLSFCIEEGKLLEKEDSYFKFWNYTTEIDEKKFDYDDLNKVTDNSIHRLIDFAAGRQIVIPLSGGFDSRLIASKLKEFNYSNVICFTYGRVENNKEKEFSERIAKSLGLKWIFIEYSDDLLKKMWSGTEAQEFKSKYSNFCSLSHIQDWFAISIMKEKALIDNNAIFVPGHSGDFVGGSHIPSFVFNNLTKKYCITDVLNEIIYQHFSLTNENKKLITEIKEKVKSELISQVTELMSLNTLDFVNLIEYWDWKERQTKYIVNSIQGYKQFGYDFWLPLWDKDFVLYWQNIPLLERKNRTNLKNYVNQIYIKNIDDYSLYSSGVLENANEIKGMKGTISHLISGVLPLRLKRYLLKTLFKRKVSNVHFLAFDALVDKQTLELYNGKVANIVGVYTSLYLCGKW
ncbi:asparagine synthase-related protein [Lonepinella sp. BR2271]|uniref:asparagine synthase-related protein n=1 Tax=Lonepinella sp. BR2271 TaxID=3434550 RepID=UPI003F6E0598